MSDQYSPYGAGKLAGAAEERERIIKLLEEQFQLATVASKKPAKEPYVLAWQDTIALIKGENK